jgi:hypothetical protein
MFEYPLRILAAPGWGKTQRLLVPIIRHLPGAALVSSVEPSIYSLTVATRACRRLHLRWGWLDTLARPVLHTREHPIFAVSFAPQGLDWAPGAVQVSWSPIPECTDYSVATRRAEGAIAGIDSHESDRGSRQDQTWRKWASAVLAAFLHAAALGGLDEDTLTGWLSSLDGSDPAPQAERILKGDPRAAPVAAQHIQAHLDQRAETTTSGVVRFLTDAMEAFLDPRARQLCGTGTDNAQFDMETAVDAGATVYLLSDTQTRGVAGPLLSMFANEMFFAAQRVAQRRPAARLDPPFVGILDELRYGPTADALPYVGSTMRKNGVCFAYAALTGTDEDGVYGDEAEALRRVCGVEINDGSDDASNQILTRVAGNQSVVQGGYAMGRASEQISDQPVLSAADLQRLKAGQAVIRARDTPEFIAYAGHCLAGLAGRRLKREAKQATHPVSKPIPAPGGAEPAPQPGAVGMVDEYLERSRP